MNFLKRAVFSLRYYWKKTVSTILNFLLLFTFVLAGLSIRAACESSLAQVRSNVDTDILLTNTTEAFQTAERNNIPLEIVQAVGALEGIRGWDFSVVLDGFARDFQAQVPKEAGEPLEGVHTALWGDRLLFGGCVPKRGGFPSGRQTSGSGG